MNTYEADYAALRQQAALYPSDAFFSAPRVTEPEALERIFSQEISALLPQSCAPGCIVDDEGRLLELTTAVSVAPGETYLVPASPSGFGSSFGAQVQQVVAQTLSDRASDVLSEGDALFGFAVEGPDLWRVLESAIGSDVSSMPYLAVETCRTPSGDVHLARTGLTGEYGVVVLAHDSSTLDHIRASLRGAGTRTIGTDALDLCMLEVRQPSMGRTVKQGQTLAETIAAWLSDPDGLDLPPMVGCRGAEVRNETVLCEIAGFRDGQAGSTHVGHELALILDDEVVGRVLYAQWCPDGQLFGLAEVEASVAAPYVAYRVAGEGCGEDVVATAKSSPLRVPTSWLRLLDP